MNGWGELITNAKYCDVWAVDGWFEHKTKVLLFIWQIVYWQIIIYLAKVQNTRLRKTTVIMEPKVNYLAKVRNMMFGKLMVVLKLVKFLVMAQNMTDKGLSEEMNMGFVA